MGFTSFAVLFLVVASNFGLPTTASRSPILIVPGIGGSQLLSRVDASLLSGSCDTDGSFNGLWVNREKFILKRQCFAEELTLVYDSATNSYSNASGVEVTAPGFGGTQTVECLATDQSGDYPYFSDFVTYFANLGYVRNETIRAAPYDWRLAADQLELRGYYTQLQLLVEEMFDESGEKVTLVVHSMGGPVTLYFLTSVVSQEWKDQYINAFIPLSGAWTGSSSTVQAVVSGLVINSTSHSIVYGSSFLDNERAVIRSFESYGTWLLPSPSIWGDTVLVTTPDRTYSANDYSDLFTDIAYPLGFEMYTGTMNISAGFPAPNVPVYCFYGTSVSTAESFIYNSSFPDVDPEVVFGDGDSVVNLLNSEICLGWPQQQSQLFESRRFPGVSHLQMVANQTVLEAVAGVVCGAGAVFTQLTVIIISIAVLFSITIV